MLFGKKKTQIKRDENQPKEAVAKKKKVSSNRRIPKDVHESIPYKSVYPNGIIEDYDGCFSKSYRIEDANFQTEDENKKEAMFMDYERLLNCVSKGMRAQLVIYNRSVDADTVRNNVLMKPRDDGHNDMRDEWNDLFLEKLQSGRNNLSKEKIFTITTEADSIITANDILKNADKDVNAAVRKINRVDTKPMTIGERLGILYDIYNYNNDFPFAKKVASITQNNQLDLNTLSRHGMSTKDLIGPDSMDWYASKFNIGEACCAAYYLDHLPTILNTDILNSISNISCNMLLSVTYVPLDQSVAVKMIREQATAVHAQIANIQKQNGGLNYIPSELENASEQTKDLLSDIMKRDQKIFKVSVIIILFAKNQEELNQYTKTLRSTVQGNLCQLRRLTNQQELAFNTALPLAEMQVSLDRILTTEAAGVFQPFSVQELYQKDGNYYGLNAISKNMIRYNRKSVSGAYTGIVLGKSGSGKSFLVKQELIQNYLNTNDQIIVIDPEGEYRKIAEALGGTVIKIDSSSKLHLNPLDMDMRFGGSGESPLVVKSDAILTLVEIMVGGEGMLSAIDKNIVQRCVSQIYRPYIDYMETQADRGITCDRSAMPTLADFYEALTKQPEPQAQMLATAIENYCVGVYDTFAHRTDPELNVDNRLIVYDVKDMTSGLKELAMEVCMNDAWNRIIQNGTNKKLTRYTDLYVDEFHLFTKTKSSARFIMQIAKRSRKYKGSMTCITQNCSDLLNNEESAAIVNNCDFTIMMNQSPSDRAILAEMYNISPALQEYITDKGAGMGIIYTGRTLIPFENIFDRPESKCFKIMDSRSMQES